MEEDLKRLIEHFAHIADDDLLLVVHRARESSSNPLSLSVPPKIFRITKEALWFGLSDEPMPEYQGVPEAARYARAKADLNVRRQPSLDAPVLRVLKKGSVAKVEKTAVAGWLKLAGDGFVSDAYTEAVEARRYKARTVANVRNGPGVERKKLATIGPGKRVVGVDEGAWVRLVDPFPNGFVHKTLLEPL